jgi:hypothetical protein
MSLISNDKGELLFWLNNKPRGIARDLEVKLHALPRIFRQKGGGGELSGQR